MRRFNTELKEGENFLNVSELKAEYFLNGSSLLIFLNLFHANKKKNSPFFLSEFAGKDLGPINYTWLLPVRSAVPVEFSLVLYRGSFVEFVEQVCG